MSDDNPLQNPLSNPQPARRRLTRQEEWNRQEQQMNEWGLTWKSLDFEDPLRDVRENVPNESE